MDGTPRTCRGMGRAGGRPSRSSRRSDGRRQVHPIDKVGGHGRGRRDFAGRKVCNFPLRQGGRIRPMVEPDRHRGIQNLTENEPKLHAPGILRTSGFSGDGSEIWFGAVGKPIMRMPQTGGAPRRFLMENARAPAWSADGNRLVYFNLAEPGPLDGPDASVHGGRARALTPNRSRSGHRTRGIGQASPTAVGIPTTPSGHQTASGSTSRTGSSESGTARATRWTSGGFHRRVDRRSG